MLRRTIWMLCGLLLLAILITLFVLAVRDCNKTGRKLFYRTNPNIYKHDYITHRNKLVNTDRQYPVTYKSNTQMLGYDHNLSTEQISFLRHNHSCNQDYVFYPSDSIYKLLYFLIHHPTKHIMLRNNSIHKLPKCKNSLFAQDKFDVKVRQRSSSIEFEIDTTYRSYLVQKILYKLSTNKYANTFKLKTWLFEELCKDDKWIGLTHLKSTKQINVGVCIIATNKYKSFVPATMKSVNLHLYRNHNVIFYLFTDDPSQFQANDNVVLHKIPSYGFPEATLYRYRIMKQATQSFRDRELDYIFYIDADYQFNRRPTLQDLPPTDNLVEGIFATKHLHNLNESFDEHHRIGSFERNENSQAYIGPNLSMDAYYCGGFNGGSREAWITAIHEMDEMIQIDESNNVMPIWHDESIFNKYCALHKPVWVFNQSFIYTEQCFLNSNQTKHICQLLKPFKPIASPLQKNHQDFRTVA